MGGLVSHIETASEPSVLVRVNKCHALDYPEHVVVKHFAKLTQAIDIESFGESLEATRLLARDVGCRHVEFGQSDLGNFAVDSIYRGTPG